MSKSSKVSEVEPDWNRERCDRFWQPAEQLLKTIRDYQRLSKRSGLVSGALKKWINLKHRFWTVVCACDIPINAQIEGGLKLTHPNGVVIHPQAKIGPNCLILQQVTLVKGVELGGHVDIGAGAKVVKAVKIGAGAKIGANAVVVNDIPPGATAVGVPAKVLSQ